MYFTTITGFLINSTAEESLGCFQRLAVSTVPLCMARACLLESFSGAGLLCGKFREVFYMESSCACNSELKDTESDHSDLTKSRSPEVDAFILYIFQIRGFK